MADLLAIPLTTLRSYANSSLEFKQAQKRGEDRAKMVDLDRQRRSNVDKLASWFIPTDEDLLEIECLVRLGWSEVKIAEGLNVPLSTWIHAKKKNPAIGEAIARGEAQGQGRLHHAKRDQWRPTEDQLHLITDYAAEGLSPQAISVKLGLHADYLDHAMPQNPEIQIAYEDGLRACEGTVTSALMKLVNNGNVAAIIYFLKSRNKRVWSDAAAPAAVLNNNDKPVNAISFEIPKQREPESFEKKAAKFRKEREKQQKLREAE